jgi:hypothetical protein
LLYDFDIKAGDTVYYPQFPTGDPTAPIYYNVIDSVFNIIVNNDTLKSYTSGSNAYLDLGSCCPGFAMHATEVLSGGEIIWNGDYQDYFPNGVRCYEDTIIGFYKSPGFNLACDTSYTISGFTDRINQPIVKVFPNPALNLLNISSKNLQNANLRILDLNGKKMHTFELLEPTSTLDISNLEPGIYIWEFNSDKGCIRDKLIISK